MIVWIRKLLGISSPSLIDFGMRQQKGHVMIYWLHFLKVLQHKWFVIVAGVRVGSIPFWRLLFHDMSKFSRAEFGPYARKFLAESTPEIEVSFGLAWLHHENRNAHHWGHWIARTGRYSGRPLPMPRSYAREMVADWWAAERSYGQSWDMHNWLVENVPKFDLHQETLSSVYQALSDIGYIEAVQEIMRRLR